MGSILIPGFGLRFALNLRNVSRIFRIEVGGKARDLLSSTMWAVQGYHRQLACFLAAEL